MSSKEMMPSGRFEELASAMVCAVLFNAKLCCESQWRGGGALELLCWYAAEAAGLRVVKRGSLSTSGNTTRLRNSTGD